jgi:ketosteroid isomerase-like protein
MSEANVEIVRRIHDQWGDDGTVASPDLFHPDIEWVNPDDAVEPGTRRGLEAFTAAAASVGDSFEGLTMSLEQFIDAGDDVVVLVTLSGRGRGSGVEVRRRQGYIWTLEGGKAIRFRWFNTPEEALEAAGLTLQDAPGDVA